ncbi:MAG: hypothetical protein ACYCW6_31160 [Candidatus Xenobia bacterium]
MTYEDLEHRFEAVLNAAPELCPPGTLARVKICHSDGRKVRGNAAAEKHYSENNYVMVSFEAQVPPALADGAERLSALGQLLVKCLADVEKAGVRDYVVLTWFRDKHLPTEAEVASFSATDVSTTLTELINDGLMLVDKVPHPKDPRIAVSTLRLNRSHGDVQRVTGLAVPAPTTVRRPLRRLAGPPLSETVLQGRR